MSRQLSLVELVKTGTFRPDRHAHLLAGELLPTRGPRADRGAWSAICRQQVNYHEAEQELAEILAGDDDDPGIFTVEWLREGYVDSFTKAVRYLHGGQRPWWLEQDGAIAKDERARHGSLA